MQDLIVGYGYVGKQLSQLLAAKKIPHMIASRSAELHASSLRPALPINLDQPIATVSASRIWYFVPPNKTNDEDRRLQHFLDGLAVSTKKIRLVYISTTGVYGDCNGEWVDETRPVNPNVARSKRRVHAERQLFQWSQRENREHVILRVAGIYGPHRLPIARLQKKLPMIAENEAPWSNRIHAEDLIRICIAAMTKANKNQIYNVADNEPSNMAHYFNQVADLADLPRPPLVTLANHDGQLSDGLLSYLNESRRIDNRKMRNDLEIELKHPSIKTGLPAAWAAQLKGSSQ